MKDVSRLPQRGASEQPAPDLQATISRVYDVALDPARLEHLLDHWEDTLAPLRENVGLNAHLLLDDAEFQEHFERASAFLDRLGQESRSPVEDYEAILAPLGKTAGFVLGSAGQVLALNAAAREGLGLRLGDRVEDLPLPDVDGRALQESLVGLISSHGPGAAMLRLQGLRDGQVLVLRLQRCKGPGGKTLVLAATSLLHWPAGFETLLRDAFELTSAETDIIAALVKGLSLAEIAAQRGRSLNTVRVQMRAILMKTETHSQVELLRLVMSMMDMADLTARANPGPRQVSRGEGRLPERAYHSLTTFDGRRLDYLMLGDEAGRSVLYMPTDYALLRWPASMEAEAAARGMRVIVPVRAGYGYSDPLPQRQDYDAALVRDVLQILDELNVESCPVISFGSDSFYAVQLARANPARFTAIIACAGVLPITRREQIERMDKWYRFIIAGARYTPHLLPFMVKAGFALARRIGKRGFIHAIYGKSDADLKTFEQAEVFDAMVIGSEAALTDTFSAHDAFTRQILGRQNTDWSEDVARLSGQLPVFFLHGVQDPQVPVATLNEFRAEHEWIDFRLYPDCGQLVLFAKWRDVLDLAERFLPQSVPHSPNGV